ncbi:hypothetical protein TrST_g10193 [Triparma strigata]|uniref:Uncharacterized protein n=1 Tax=Triparma strigata TaxID=1606541 RepID=A0A9W7ABB2_9STRA|nr:hypothetical protein TrST_g10193 [Triparma strigata]
MSSPPSQSSPPSAPSSEHERSKKILSNDVSSSPPTSSNSSSEYFKKEVVYRSISVAPPPNFNAGVVHRGMAAPLMNPDFGISTLNVEPGKEEFRVPEGKQRHVGGSRQLPPAPTVEEVKGGRSSEGLGLDRSKTLNLPGLSHLSPSLSFSPPLRLVLPPLPLPLITSTISKLLTHAKCDFEYLPAKAKYKAVTTLENHYLNFVCQVYNAPGGGEGYVFEIARREGDAVVFSKVWRSIREGLEIMMQTSDFSPSSLKVSPILDAPPPLSPSLISSAPSVTPSSLTPLSHMLTSRILEQQLYASQVLAKMITSSPETRRIIGNSGIIKELADVLEGINLRNMLPLEHAILRHITYTLAGVSEDLLCLQTLQTCDILPVCLRIVGEGEVKIEDLEGRREAARCAANVLGGGGREGIEEGQVERFKSFVNTLKDDKLRAQCKRVIEKVKDLKVV